jgi:ribosomal 50S subunit-recycling heat shock protein
MIAFEIGDGGKITLNGKEEKVADLKVGDQLNFWVHEGEFGVMPTLTDRPMRIIKPDAMTAN